MILYGIKKRSVSRLFFCPKEGGRERKRERGRERETGIDGGGEREIKDKETGREGAKKESVHVYDQVV
jgi:hypothetical protein